MAKIKQDLGQLFENNSNCYADTTDDSVVMAMDKEQFVKIVTDLLTECVSADCSHEETAALPLQNVSIPVKITKCKTFKHPDPYQQEKCINEWLSSNKIVIKHTTQSSYTHLNKSTYGDYLDYGTLITIFYEDE